MESPQKDRRLDELIEEVSVLLEATVRAEDGIFHLSVPLSPTEDDEDEERDEEDDEIRVSVAISVSEDAGTLFVTRRLCALDESINLHAVLQAIGETVHVQLSIDEDNDLMLGGASPIGADPEWIADIVGEIAEFAPELAEDAQEGGDV